MSYTHQKLNNYLFGLTNANLLSADEKKECEDARGLDSLEEKKAEYKRLQGIHNSRWRSR